MTQAGEGEGRDPAGKRRKQAGRGDKRQEKEKLLRVQTIGI